MNCKQNFSKLINKTKEQLMWIFWTKLKPPGGPQSTKEKQDIIINIGQKHKIETFIETGTYIGETVKRVIPFFKQIYTIELNKKLYIYNKKKFKKNKNVKVINGDSGKILKEIFGPVLYCWWVGRRHSDTQEVTLL